MSNNNYDRERDRDYNRDRDYDRDRDRDRDSDRDRNYDRDDDRGRDRDRDRDRDYDRDNDRNRDRDTMDERQIREEIDRLRREVYNLKDALENRRAENQDLKMAIKQAEKNNAELLTAITATLNDMSTRMDNLNGLDKLKSSIRDEFEEANMPMEAKCQAIEERLKTLQDNLDYTEPMKEQMGIAAEGMRETLAEKFGTKTIGDVLQKLASISTFLIADSIGIVVLLALMCFFIISLIK
ncbi:hypothetical protein [Pseudobutyrivibrio xylanivorans]|uniref:Uncharacterized protein n=1 Tax=Pseudobutyrivibrio xylanivorans DSM 14809 TaxID=1123012 RepID=A0A1M6BA33_PSEXY|nr:hypothetical protein [Pseudobutyrivibrio xylanivorans]SHI45589.1 hypothetical protein SAMN02745725_00389 [Pseudobutyrivibrio xylanivorans DSM 14809]